MPRKRDGWIGVDLDGTLAHYTKFTGPYSIGAPIPRMVERVKRWIAEGYSIRIMTARAWNEPEGSAVVVPLQMLKEALS